MCVLTRGGDVSQLLELAGLWCRHSAAAADARRFSMRVAAFCVLLLLTSNWSTGHSHPSPRLPRPDQLRPAGSSSSPGLPPPPDPLAGCADQLPRGRQQGRQQLRPACGAHSPPPRSRGDARSQRTPRQPAMLQLQQVLTALPVLRSHHLPGALAGGGIARLQQSTASCSCDTRAFRALHTTSSSSDGSRDGRTTASSSTTTPAPPQQQPASSSSSTSSKPAMASGAGAAAAAATNAAKAAAKQVRVGAASWLA